MYLSKLKDLVPYMPKNKKLSKLEVIQNVIDYICDLQSALETTGAGNSAAVAAAFDASAVLGGALSGSRQPLGIRSSPNTIHRPSSQQSNGSSTASHSPSSVSSCDLNPHTVSTTESKKLKVIYYTMYEICVGGTFKIYVVYIFEINSSNSSNTVWITI